MAFVFMGKRRGDGHIKHYHKMGIDTVYVLPVKDHLSIFNCNLCSNLVSLDGYVTIPCGHCFCRGCFRAWSKTQHPKSSACGCPNCGVPLASGDSESRCAEWQVRPLVKAQPLVHQMLSQVKVLCPCRFSVRICYWTGNYAGLEQHISTCHAQPETEGNELPSKSRMTLESAPEHQKSTSRPGLELGVRSDSALLKKSDHIQKSSTHQPHVLVMKPRDTSHSTIRRPRRRSKSMPEIMTQSYAPPTNTLNAMRSRHGSGNGTKIDDMRSSEGKRTSRKVSKCSRLTESNHTPSLWKSNDSQSKARTVLDTKKEETMASSNVEMNVEGSRQHSNAGVVTSDDAFKSDDKKSTREVLTSLYLSESEHLVGPALRPEASTTKNESLTTCRSKELATTGRRHPSTESSSLSVEATTDATTIGVCSGRESTRADDQKVIDGLLEKQSVNAPNSTSAPTALAIAASSLHSKLTKRSLRRPDDSLHSRSRREIVVVNQGESHSKSPDHKHHHRRHHRKPQ
jgi:hypothetical protein